MQPDDEVPITARAADHDPSRNTTPLVEVLREELSNLTIRYLATRLLTAIIPNQAGNRLRTLVWRGLGWKVGVNAVLLGDLRLSGRGAIQPRLSIGPGVWINEGCRIELNDDVTIGENSAIGHDVLILTSTHRLGPRSQRAAGLLTGPVVIGSGSWIGARSVVLPGVRIGSGAVVSAGSVVNKDVPPNAIVSGVPAAVVVQRMPG